MKKFKSVIQRKSRTHPFDVWCECPNCQSIYAAVAKHYQKQRRLERMMTPVDVDTPFAGRAYAADGGV